MGILLEEALTEQIVGGLIEVHKVLGPGLLESAYEQCLCHELSLRGLKICRQVELPVRYKGVLLDCGYRLDLMVEDKVILELKSVAKLTPIDRAQLMTYLRLSGKRIGLLVNFNEPTLVQGLVRIVL